MLVSPYYLKIISDVWLLFKRPLIILLSKKLNPTIVVFFGCGHLIESVAHENAQNIN
jgi:hypothetical protein